MLDGLYVEQIGIPAAVVCTEPFMEQSRAMAAVHSYGGYPIIQAFHPLATATPTAIEQEAERILGEVLELLLDPASSE